jgi:uncharacterized repeat protein (TIGR03803 family)
VHGIIRQTNFKRKITMPTKHLWFVCAFAAAGMAQAPAQTATESAIYSFFTFPYGANPYAPLARDSADNLYGTTNQGGQADVGLVFKLSSSGKETTLHSFLGGNDGANPYSGVLLADGNLYGTTYQGEPRTRASCMRSAHRGRREYYTVSPAAPMAAIPTRA